MDDDFIFEEENKVTSKRHSRFSGWEEQEPYEVVQALDRMNGQIYTWTGLSGQEFKELQSEKIGNKKRFEIIEIVMSPYAGKKWL